jgi:MFS family permease
MSAITEPRVQATIERRTLTVAALGTLLVLAVFSGPVTTVIDSTRALHGSLAGATWTLSGMSLGLAAALLTVGALADRFGRRRVLGWSTALLVATNWTRS